MTKLYIGLLSGTSMDGIDVAVIDYSNIIPSIKASKCIPFPNDFNNACIGIKNNSQCSLTTIGELDNWAGELFANAVIDFLAEVKIPAQNIEAIGSHGQTIWHAPNSERPFTMQIGDPNVIAVKTGITTVADFRRADMAAGGQGAPFAPVFHQAIFASPTEDRCIVNIGGISNISVLANGTVSGFDSGPGNCLMDVWTKKHFNIDYDQNGEIAKTGKVHDQLLKICLDDTYFSKATPKSTGPEYFNLQWLQEQIEKCSEQDIAPADVLATLNCLTATSISYAVKQLAPNSKVFICGGGAYNLTLMQELSIQLKQNVLSTQVLGIDPSWVEAALFAWLAKETVSGNSINLSTITGSKRSVVLGGIYGYSK